jgi:tight adherence protein B
VEIVIIAVIIVIITWLGFMIYDKRKSAKRDVEVETKSVTNDPSFEFRDNKTENLDIIDYSVYHLSKNEYVTAVLIGSGLFFLVGYLFYQNLFIAFILSLLGYFFPKIRRVQLRDKRKRDLSLQFKNMLFSLSSALSAGNSVERAFRTITKDLELLYPDPNTYIIREMELINRRIANGGTIEAVVRDFSNRADIEDIQSFAEVFTASTKTGGDLVEIISRTSTIISEKLEIQQEIQVLISGKQLESKILMVAPLALIGFMTYAADGYMDPLFDFPGPGPVIMTVCIGVLCFVYWLLQKIMNIKV